MAGDIQEEEAVVDTLCTLCQHPHTSQGKALHSHETAVLCSCQEHTSTQDFIHSPHSPQVQNQGTNKPWTKNSNTVIFLRYLVTVTEK